MELAAVLLTGAKEMILALMIVQHTVVRVIGSVEPVLDQAKLNVMLTSHTPPSALIDVNGIPTGVEKTVMYTMVFALQLVKDVLDQPL